MEKLLSCSQISKKKGLSKNAESLCHFVAGPTRLELATSGVTGRRSNQLNYDPAIIIYVVGGTGLEPVTLGL